LHTVAKPELGTKRLCGSCAAKFYDLNKTPITCPKCGTIFEVVPPVTTRPRPDRARAVHEPAVEAPDVEEAELISLEEADEEVQGKKAPLADEAEAAEDLEVDETIEDDATDPLPLIEEEGEEDTDVSEIIGGDLKDEEET
jgi:uncharacterized protein (TIGR02300 family)